MSVAGPPTTEADLSTAEQQEKSYQAFLDALDLRDRIEDCVLFPPEFDFSKACPCDQCGSKIAKLKEFEIEITNKKHLVMNRLVQMENNEILCLELSTAVWWTKRMFDIFHKELEAVSEKSGVELTHVKGSSGDNLGDTSLNMQRMLVDYGIVYASPEEKDPYVATYVADDARYDIFDEIDTGRFHYGYTKAKDTAYGFLKEIEDIEIDHDKKKDYAEAQKKVLDPSISKNYIEKQMELVKKLPVRELKFEFDELISKIRPRNVHIERNANALEYISNTCFFIIKTMKEFWKESPKGNAHISNGWEQILDSLINKVKSFEKEWKKDYASIYTPFDRSDPKRQATK